MWRHQVAELLPLAVRVTEYQMGGRRCPACGKRTRADLPPGVPRRPFGAWLTAVIALLSGRYRLSRREVRQLLHDLWQVKLSLGAVVHQEQAQSAALAPVVAEARAAIQQAVAVHMDEWRPSKGRDIRAADEMPGAYHRGTPWPSARRAAPPRGAAVS